MNIVLISPHFKPMSGGVADYSYRFAEELADQGHDVIVITRMNEEVTHSHYKIITVENYGLSLTSKLREITEDHRTDAILFEWTPLAFAPKTYGIIPTLALTIFAMRKTPIHIMVHESHYPVQFNPKGLLIGLPHYLQFLLFLAVANKLYFSHEANRLYWSRFLPFKKKLRTLPVYSNIPLVSELSELKENKTPPYRLLYFGGQHPTNDLNLLRATYDYCKEKLGQEVQLSIVGIKKENTPDILKVDGIHILGYLDEEEVSQEISKSTLMLSPFKDGASTRRGSIMAALSHQKVVVTIEGHNTCDDIPWKDIAACALAGNQKAFQELTLHLLKDDKARENLASQAFHFYQNNFSPSQVVRSYIISNQT